MRCLRLLLVTMVAVISSAALVPAGQLPTGSISGRVVDAGTGAPVEEATVDLSVAKGKPSTQRVLTDAKGAFAFHGLSEGTFVVLTHAPGFIAGAAGAWRPSRSPEPQPIELRAGESVQNVVVPIVRSGAITGIVTDESGEPAVEIDVRAFRFGFAGGGRRVLASVTATTDDRGVFRFPDLMPADYVVAFVPIPKSMPASALDEAERSRGNQAATSAWTNTLAVGGASMLSGPSTAVGDWQLTYGSGLLPPAPAKGRVLVYPPKFYGGTSMETAGAVTVTSGAERSGVDLQLVPEPAARVTGRVIGPDGPERYFGVHLVPANADLFATASEVETASSITNANGEFSFFGVPPGAYVITGKKGPTLGLLFAATPIRVTGSDVDGVAVPLRFGARIEGRIVPDAVSDGPLPRVDVTVETAGSGINAWSSWTAASGVFSSFPLRPGRYFVRADASPGWSVEAIMSGGQDIADSPIDITPAGLNDVTIRVSSRPTQLKGTVRDAQGRPDPSGTVLIFPVDPARWTEYSSSPRRLRLLRVSRAGAYAIEALPTGDYAVLAIADADAARWPDPSWLTTLLATARRVTLDQGTTHVLDLTTTRSRTP